MGIRIRDVPFCVFGLEPLRFPQEAPPRIGLQLLELLKNSLCRICGVVVKKHNSAHA